MSAISYLNEAAAIALRILIIVQDVRSRNNAFNDLARDACGLVYTIAIECQSMIKEGHNVPVSVQIHISSLARNLAEVEKFAQKKVERNAFKKIIFHSKDMDEITRYRQLLRQSLDVFGIQTNISIQENLSRILASIEKQGQELKENRNKHDEEQRHAAEEISTRLETLRIHEEDRQAQQRLEEFRKGEREEAEKQKRKAEQARRETEKFAEDQDENESRKKTHKPHLSPGPNSGYNGHASSPPPYPMGPFGYAPSSPYLYPGYPSSPYTTPSPIPSMSNISGSAISFGGAPAYVSNVNSGNVSNTVITNSMNGYPSRNKSPRRMAHNAEDADN
ncbi:hypothetical protein CPB84DRAFT_1784817 [Gymnopilus junonius]|uniref:Uncharacterized protein n=1 Tax=Gymnopilus junonius TaxID=109634 RepID=A0A9P5NIR0_GYMJU|nr:hypothetical protein CPB84DRAFT_1784817 [Gymnopilus junonius]